MRKNTTLLLNIYEIGKQNSLVFQAMAPLFQINVYRTSLANPLKVILNNPKLNYQPRKKQFDRILVIASNQQSNARRKAFINQKRNDLIHFINNNGQKQMIYVISLMQINQFVPNDHLIKQLDIVLKNKGIIQTKLKRQNQKKEQNGILNLKNNILFPFNWTQWQILLNSKFSNSKKVNRYHLQQSYFFMQINNLYMIEFSRNRELMYLDIKDFDQFLTKFNFIRYFYQTNSDKFIAQKYSQKLLKSLKWRTSQTQQYLLMTLRSNSWQKFLLIVQDFCVTYENIYGKSHEQVNQINKR